MASTFHGLEIGKRGLYAQQLALTTTGHNIANANTEGYSRQRAEMQATSAIPYPGINTDTTPAQLGTGVQVEKLVRLREDYLDVQLRGENKYLGYWEAKSDTYTKIEEMFNEPSDNGLAFAMDEFWKGWEELSKNPDSSAARAVISQKGVALAETFNYLSSSLDEMQTDLKNVIITKTNQVNSLAEQISSLNDQISRVVPHNYQPNDLYDQRDLLIDQLSKIVNVKVSQPDSKNGMVDIYVGTEPIVSGIKANKFSIDFDQTSGLVNPDSIKIGGNQVNLDSGELLGRIESYGLLGKESSSIIPTFKNKLNDLVKTFTGAVNEVHEKGLSLENINGSSIPAVKFFIGDTAESLVVNPAILNSLDKIAAAKVEVDGKSSTGNGKNAEEIAKLKFVNLTFGDSTSTADDFYRNIIAKLGIDSQQAERMKDNSEVIIHQVENRRQSVSGVSLDEEMTNMIRFQQAYNAAARMVTVMDQCLEKVINGMGRVGL